MALFMNYYAMKTFKAFAILLLLVMSSTLAVNAQVTDTAQLQQMIDSSNFIFKARSAQAQGGASRVLTDEYDLKVNRNEVVSFLPYYGRAYSISPGEDGGIKFTSTDFKYTPEKTKNGWRIMIIPRDAKDITQLYLDVSTGGYATLQVTSNNRQAISYYGVIEKDK